MKVIAYSADRSHCASINAMVPEGVELSWLPEPTALSGVGEARVLVLLASRASDTGLEALINLFGPRPVLLVDLTPDGHWYNAELSAWVQLVELDDMNATLHRLCSARAMSPARSLALMSARNEYDGAVLAAHIAWALHQRSNERVLVLDLGMPQSALPAYLDMEPHISFLDLVENSQALESGWLDDKPIEALPGIDVIGMASGKSDSRLNAQDLTRTLQALKTRYAHLIINLVGMQPSGLLNLMAAEVEQQWVLSDQKNLSLASALELAEHLLGLGLRPGGVNLLLAPYVKSVLPARDSIESKIPLPLRGTLPWMPEILTQINAGTLLPPGSDTAPLLQAVEQALWLHEPVSWWRKLSTRSA
ncbi:hypothetical protein A8C75_20070 [Marinobacterium aestuarii]|uniref:Uncharacterized protein n=1 Tax=Marinobacterium aestuarii TaxID=1821621 RepID=A0A1A9F3K1_9GAMM|nr:hypothetical protein [Marinobacterium aestuarii]ANG64540.1 hypothetical protein A8C75_20070 [Marinobacterium aestuarii]